MLNIRLTTHQDYSELSDWWKWHRWSNPPTIELLDNLKYGIMVSNEQQNICAGFLYFTNARAFALLEFIVSTYKVKDKTKRKDALELLIASLLDIAKKRGVKTIFTSVRHPSLIQRYKDCGFVITSKNSNEMVAFISNSLPHQH